MCKRNKHESFHHYSNIRVAWAEVKKKKSHSHDMVLVEWLSHNGNEKRKICLLEYISAFQARQDSFNLATWSH